MSSTSIQPNKIPAAISNQLSKLRGGLRRFLLVDGLSKVLLAAVVIVLLDLLLDRVFKMDLAQRGIMLVVMIGSLLAIAVWRLVKPMSKRISDDGLILQVEEGNRELNEGVISAAQFSRDGRGEEFGYSPSMVDATIQQGSTLAEKVNFNNIIDGSAMMRNILLLLASVIGLGAIGVGVAKTEFWNTWFNRNILLGDAQWPRSTVLMIDGVEDGKLVLLRGEDHKQLVRVDENCPKPDVDVSIEFENGNNRTTQKMRKTGDLEHSLVFRNLSQEFRFRAKGGDDTTDWIDVVLVDPPGWSELNMSIEPPEYTALGKQKLPPGGGPHPIPEGSTLSIKGSPNKKFTSAELRTGDKQWTMQQGDDGWSLDIPAAEIVSGKYIFDLVDEGDRRSSRPTTFDVKLKADRAPSVRATLLGISGKVVPRVRIPFSFTAGDEYSITAMGVNHSWLGSNADSVAQESSTNMLKLLPELAVKLRGKEIDDAAVIDMEPMNIPTNTSLRLTITATDNNTLSGPGIGKSREFLIQVVTEEELRSDLLRREIEQRQAFELAVRSQERLIDDMNRLVDESNKANSELDPDQIIDQLRDTQRRQKLVGTNISRIANRFEDFLVEAMNNRLDEAEEEVDRSQSIEVRFNERIIQPIRALDSTTIIEASQLIEGTQRAIKYDTGSGQKAVNREELTASAQKAIEVEGKILEAMRTILSAMQDSETFQEVVNKVIEIKKNEEKIRELARKKRESEGEKGIFDDEDSEDMFDDEEEDK